MIANETLLETIFSNFAEAVFILDAPTAGLVYANGKMRAMFGFTASDVPHLTIFDLDGEKAGQPAQRIREMLSRACQGDPQLFVWKARKKDGSAFDAQISLQKAAAGIEGRIIALVREVKNTIQTEAEKRVEERLQKSESRVRRKLDSILDPDGDIGELELADILDAPQIQALMDDYYQTAGLKMGILDLKGRVLVGVGWQEICMKFHRGHPETLKRCIESDTVMSEGIAPGEFSAYKCRNNMWHLVTPIVIGGKHMGNLFMGQFFFDNEELDYDFFRSQAKAYRFPEAQYIAALQAVPRYSQAYVNRGKTFFLRLIEMLSTLSYANIKLARLLSERDRLMERLRAANKVVRYSREKYQAIVDNFDGYIYTCSQDYRVEFMNKKLIERTGYDATGEPCFTMMHDRDSVCPWCRNERVFAAETLHWEMFSPKDQRWFYVVNVPIPHSDGSISKQSMMLDITGRKLAEEELKRQKQLLGDLNRTLEERVREIRRLNETLEERVAERTAELENRASQLQQLALELTDAEDRERRRIASILHDDFQQELAYIKLELVMLQNKADLKGIQQRLEILVPIIGECIDKSRNLSYEINPPALIQSGLEGALRELAQNMKIRFDLNVTVNAQNNAEPHSIVLASILFRSIRELLFNVIKHAGVNWAGLDVRGKNGMIHIRVKDLGNGFVYDPARPRGHRETGFGLWNIEDRITFLGGYMEIETAPGKGCCIELSVPNPASPEAISR